MPKLPTYQPQVRDAALPNVRQNIQTTGENFGGGQSLDKAFGAAQGVLNDAADIYAKEKNKADAFAVKQAGTKARELQINAMRNPQTGAYLKKGENAINITDGYLKGYDDDIAKITEGLANEDQKQMFSVVAAQRRNELFEDLGRHEQGQRVELQGKITKDLIDVNTQHAIQNGDNPARVKQSLNEIEGAIIDDSAFDGDRGVTARRRIQEAHSAVHRGIIDRFTSAGKDREAQAYYESIYPTAKLDNAKGLVEKGNVDIQNRPRVRNADGSISTVRSIGVNVDGKEVLIPTVSDDGRIMTNKEAVESYRKTGKHLGVFDSPAAATEYAKNLHDQQEAMVKGGDIAPLTPKDLEEVQKTLRESTTTGESQRWAKVLLKEAKGNHYEAYKMANDGRIKEPKIIEKIENQLREDEAAQQAGKRSEESAALDTAFRQIIDPKRGGVGIDKVDPKIRGALGIDGTKKVENFAEATEKSSGREAALKLFSKYDSMAPEKLKDVEISDVMLAPELKYHTDLRDKIRSRIVALRDKDEAKAEKAKEEQRGYHSRNQTRDALIKKYGLDEKSAGAVIDYSIRAFAKVNKDNREATDEDYRDALIPFIDKGMLDGKLKRKPLPKKKGPPAVTFNEATVDKVAAESGAEKKKDVARAAVRTYWLLKGSNMTEAETTEVTKYMTAPVNVRTGWFDGRRDRKNIIAGELTLDDAPPGYIENMKREQAALKNRTDEEAILTLYRIRAGKEALDAKGKNKPYDIKVTN